MTDAGLHTLIGARPRIQAGRRLHVVKYTLSHRDAANTPFDVVIEGQSSGVDPGLLAPFEAVGLTWWIEKLGWFRALPTQLASESDADRRHRRIRRNQAVRRPFPSILAIARCRGCRAERALDL
jgi:hypothetical protein